MIPLFEKDGFIICFEALEEEASSYDHLVKECGGALEQWEATEHYAFFCAKVSAWQNGVEIAADYLGCCFYENVSDFYTVYANDYFNSMAETVVSEAKEKVK